VARDEPKEPQDPAPEEPEPPADDPGSAGPDGDGPSRDDADEEFADSEDGEEEHGLPPPQDDGPLHVIPIRHLPLSQEGSSDARPAVAQPLRAPAARQPAARPWQWVPLGALLALLTTTLASVVFTSAVPETQGAVQALAEAVTGLQDDQVRLQAVEAVLDGPQGDAVRWALIGMAVSFVVGLFLAGGIAGYVGRAGGLEAGLGTATFAALSLVFMGGFSIVTLPSLLLAFALGWLGGWVGRRLRLRRDAKRADTGLR
jgi:hypothetical protein